jgi:hypothetical protein
MTHRLGAGMTHWPATCVLLRTCARSLRIMIWLIAMQPTKAGDRYEETSRFLHRKRLSDIKRRGSPPFTESRSHRSGAIGRADFTAKNKVSYYPCVGERDP